MIENDHQLRAALEWIDYWKQLVGQEQSWLGREEARRQISILSRQVDTYRARQGVSVDAATPAQGQPEEPAPGAAANSMSGTAAPGASSGTAAPATMAPGTSPPGTTPPGTTPPGTATPGNPAPGKPA